VTSLLFNSFYQSYYKQKKTEKTNRCSHFMNSGRPILIDRTTKRTTFGFVLVYIYLKSNTLKKPLQKST